MNTLILAVDGTTVDTSTFWGTSIGSAIKAVLVGVGIIVVLIALLKTVKEISNGKPGNAVKVVVAAAVVAAFMFKPELFSTLITLAGDIVGKIFDSISSLTGGGKSS